MNSQASAPMGSRAAVENSPFAGAGLNGAPEPYRLDAPEVRLPQGFDPPEGARGLAFFDRTRPKGSPEGFLVTVESYEGHGFVKIQRWFLGSSGWHWDSAKSITIRARDVDAMLAALAFFKSGGR